MDPDFAGNDEVEAEEGAEGLGADEAGLSVPPSTSR